MNIFNQPKGLTLLRLFIKWFFQYRGSTKIPPNETVTGFYKLTGRKLSERTCKVCHQVFWSIAKHPSPVCTTWPCYKHYYSSVPRR